MLRTPSSPIILSSYIIIHHTPSIQRLLPQSLWSYLCTFILSVFNISFYSMHYFVDCSEHKLFKLFFNYQQSKQMAPKKGSKSKSQASSTTSADTVSESGVYKDSSASVGVKRAQWGNQLQFIFTSVGYAVGLGNIWRFPIKAYENGGGAFLIPYLTCSCLFAFPIVYLDMTLGQYTNSGPALAHGQVRPIFQGIGWGMVGVTALVSVYYNVILAWAILYLYTIVTGQSKMWVMCNNRWNTESCYSWAWDQVQCSNKTLNLTDCIETGNNQWFRNRTEKFTGTPATEEFYKGWILGQSDRIDDLGGFHWQLLAALVVAWVVTCLALLWGLKVMGNLAYVTGSLPYIIIAILFVRGVTLEGAEKGIKFYLTEPVMSAALSPTAWKEAAVQLCFSMAIGFGGFISLSSFNAKKHNCYRDALIVSFADGFMSIFGGVAVFSILGFMAKQSNQEIEKVVKSGTGLAFIAYPEAMSQMPAPWLWSFLFFLMLFLLGISTQFGFAETVITAIYDQFPHTRPYKKLLAIIVCCVLFCIGLIFSTKAGIYYFNIVDACASSFSAVSLTLMEVMLIAHLYGMNNYIEKDLRQMFGQPRNKFSRFVGPSGYYIQVMWCVFTPLLSFIVMMILLKEQIHMDLKYDDKVPYPVWANVLGWIVSFVPFLLFPLPICYDIYKFRKYQRSWRELFRLHPKWPSYYEQIKLPLIADGKLQPLTISEGSEKDNDDKMDGPGGSGGVVKRRSAVKEKKG